MEEITRITWADWRLLDISNSQLNEIFSEDPAYNAVLSNIEALKAQKQQQEAVLATVANWTSWLDSATASRVQTQLNGIDQQLQALESNRDAIIKSRFDTEQLSNPNLIANRFNTSGWGIDPLTGQAVTNNAIFDPSQTGNIAQDLADRAGNIINFQQSSWDEQLNAIQEARNLASGIWQAQLNRTGQVFNQASRWALAAWAVSEGIIWGTASRAWASAAQRLASINASQASTAERLWVLNQNRLAQENAILDSYLAGINTAIWQENLIRSTTAWNISEQASNLSTNLWRLAESELWVQRWLPDALLWRQANQISNAQRQLELNEAAAKLWVAAPSFIWWVWTVPATWAGTATWWGWTWGSSFWGWWWGSIPPIVTQTDPQWNIIIDSEGDWVDETPTNNIDPVTWETPEQRTQRLQRLQNQVNKNNAQTQVTWVSEFQWLFPWVDRSPITQSPAQTFANNQWASLAWPFNALASWVWTFFSWWESSPAASFANSQGNGLRVIAWKIYDEFWNFLWNQ